jgi:hypothetical protein
MAVDLPSRRWSTTEVSPGRDARRFPPTKHVETPSGLPQHVESRDAGERVASPRAEPGFSALPYIIKNLSTSVDRAKQIR